MEKNRVIIVDYSHEKKNDNNVKKNDSINVSDIFSTFKKRYKNDVKEFKDTRKIKTINQFAYTFPVFYKKELKNSFYFFVLWFLFFIFSLSMTIFFICRIFLSSFYSPWLLVLIIPFFLIIFALTIVYIDKYYRFRCEAKEISFKEQKTLSFNIQKVYKRLKLGYINVNWMSFTSYVLSILIFLIVSLIAFLDPDGPNADFAEFWNFLERKPGNFNFNASYFFVATTCVVAFSTAVFFHFFLLITNYIRYSRIENYYGYQIIPNDEMLISKKTKNRRNLFIFLILCGLVFYVGYVLYKIIKKKKTATISVK